MTEAIGTEIELELFYWTDSMVTLYWINGEWYSLKVYVGNCVKLIQGSSRIVDEKFVREACCPQN